MRKLFWTSPLGSEGGGPTDSAESCSDSHPRRGTPQKTTFQFVLVIFRSYATV